MVNDTVRGWVDLEAVSGECFAGSKTEEHDISIAVTKRHERDALLHTTPRRVRNGVAGVIG